MTDNMITRRDALRAGALGVGALGLAACGSVQLQLEQRPPAASNINEPGHVEHAHLERPLRSADTSCPAIKTETGITVNVTLGSDDASMFIKAQQSGQFDIVSADALWVPYYHQQGLTYAFDINSISRCRQAAVLGCPRVPDLAEQQRLSGLPAGLVGAADLLQPQVRQPRADVV